MQQQLTTVSVGQPAVLPGFVTVSPGQQVIFISPQAKCVSPTYKHRQTVHLGVALMISGALSIIFNIVDLAISDVMTNDYYNHDEYFYSSFGFVGHGIWSGVLCIIAGGFCIGAGKTKSICQIRAVIVFGIIAACCCGAQLGVAITGAVVVGYDYTSGYGCSTSFSDSWDDICRKFQVLLAMEILLAIFGMVGGIAAIWSSAFGCQGASCTGCCCIDDSQQFIGVVQQFSLPMTVLSQQQQQQQRGGQQQMAYSVPANVQLQQGIPQGVQYTVAPPSYTTAAVSQPMVSGPSAPQVNYMAPQQSPVNTEFKY